MSPAEIRVRPEGPLTYDILVLRRLFTLASVLSLLLCIATAVLWVRSYRRADSIGRSRPYRGSVQWDAGPYVTAGRGKIYVQWGRFISDDGTFPPLGPVDWKFSRHRVDDELNWIVRDPVMNGPTAVPELSISDWTPVQTIRSWKLWGFGWSRDELHETRPWHLVSYALSFPLWCLLLILLALPAQYLRSRGIAQRTVPRTVCPLCGYDLRATPGRCPECGHVSGKVMA